MPRPYATKAENMNDRQNDGSGARTTCQRCGGPYDEDIDSWGCCAPCLTIELGTQNDGSERP